MTYYKVTMNDGQVLDFDKQCNIMFPFGNGDRAASFMYEDPENKELYCLAIIPFDNIKHILRKDTDDETKVESFEIGDRILIEDTRAMKFGCTGTITSLPRHDDTVFANYYGVRLDDQKPFESYYYRADNMRKITLDKGEALDD